MIKNIFVDMDGVVTDFVGGVIKLHNLDREETLSKMKGSYSINDILNLKPAEFWGRIDEDNTFWESLELLEEANTLMAVCEKHVGAHNTYFLSSPAMSPKCHYGKAAWVQKHFPKYINRLILTGHKYFLADRSRVLIDDSDKNLKPFIEHGGHAILVPRPWNSMHTVADKSLDLTTRRLTGLCSRGF